MLVSAQGRRQDFAFEPTRDRAWALAVREFAEDPAHDGGLGHVDAPPAALRLSARIEFADDLVAIAETATRSALAHPTFEPAPGLLGQVFEEEGVHRGP